MSARDVELILRRLDQLEGTVLQAQRDVRELQLWRARIEGAQWAVGRVPVVLASLAALASVLAVVVALAS